MEREHDAIIPTIIPTAPSSPNGRERAARTHPRNATGGRWHPPAHPTCPPTFPFTFHQPAPLDVPGQAAGKGKAEGKCPSRGFQGGKAPDEEDKDKRSELLERCIMSINPPPGGGPGPPWVWVLEVKSTTAAEWRGGGGGRDACPPYRSLTDASLRLGLVIGGYFPTRMDGVHAADSCRRHPRTHIPCWERG